MRVAIKGKADVAPCWASINHWEVMEEVRDDLYAHKYAPMRGAVAVHARPHKNTRFPHNSKKSSSFIFLKYQHLQLSVDQRKKKKKVHFAFVVPQLRVWHGTYYKVNYLQGLSYVLYSHSIFGYLLDANYQHNTQVSGNVTKCVWYDKRKASIFSHIIKKYHAIR